MSMQGHAATAEQSHALQAAHGQALAQTKEYAHLAQLNINHAATVVHNQEHVLHALGALGAHAQEKASASHTQQKHTLAAIAEHNQRHAKKTICGAPCQLAQDKVPAPHTRQQLAEMSYQAQ